MHDVVIENLTKQKQIIILKHQEYCVKVGQCFCNRNGTPKSEIILAGQKTTMSGHVICLRQVIEAKYKNQIATKKVQKQVAGSAKAVANANSGDGGNGDDEGNNASTTTTSTPVSSDGKKAAQKNSNGKGNAKSRRRRGSQG